MKKLEDIPKKQIFTVPDRYFEHLPLKIQDRLDDLRPARQESFVFRYKLQYALPLVLLLAVGSYWLVISTPPANAESILASVATEDLVAYLDDSELSTDDLLESMDFDDLDAEEIESEVYELNLENEDLENILEDIDFENI